MGKHHIRGTHSMSTKTPTAGIDLDAMRRAKQIVRLQGKEYVLFSGLLRTAHNNGLKSVDTEIIGWDSDARAAVVRAAVEGTRGRYTAHGDASPDNVGRSIAGACLRMAETRAIARALRSYLGIGMTALSELPGGGPAAVADTRPGQGSPPPRKAAAKPDPRVPLDIGAVLINYRIDAGAVVKHCREQDWGDPLKWDEGTRSHFMRDLVAGRIPALYAVAK